MDWSKVKQRAEERFADSLRGRLTLHLTRYRMSHDQLYELWLSWDGQKLAGVSDGKFYKTVYDHQAAHGGAGGKPLLWDEAEASSPSGWLSKRLIEESLNLSVEALVSHESPVLRALGMADSRFGERRLRKVDISNEHPFVASVARARCLVEGILLSDTERADGQLSG